MAQEPDIDLGAVTEALNNKTDTDVQNTTNVGSAQIANFALPGSTVVTKEWGNSGDTYTVPADGWLFAQRQAGAAAQTLSIQVLDGEGNFLYQDISLAPNTNAYLCCLVPITKDHVAKIFYQTPSTAQPFQFIYAKGTEPQS